VNVVIIIKSLSNLYEIIRERESVFISVPEYDILCNICNKKIKHIKDGEIGDHIEKCSNRVLGYNILNEKITISDKIYFIKSRK
jgi:hypothetical protein